MATHSTVQDYAHEKQEVQYVEHAHDSPTDSSHELQKERTLEGIDMNNSYAVKGDDSDGKVEWSVRSIFAAVFLAALYTGRSSSTTAFVILANREQVHKSFSTLLEPRLVLLRKIWVWHVVPHGFQQLTFLQSLRHVLTLATFKTCSASAILLSSAHYAFALVASL